MGSDATDHASDVHRSGLMSSYMQSLMLSKRLLQPVSSALPHRPQNDEPQKEGVAGIAMWKLDLHDNVVLSLLPAGRQHRCQYCRRENHGISTWSGSTPEELSQISIQVLPRLAVIVKILELEAPFVQIIREHVDAKYLGKLSSINLLP